MKKLFAVLAIVGLLAGCAGTSFLCTNGQTVANGLQLVINQANSVISAIQTSYPGLVPPGAQAVLSAAQVAKDVASMALAQVCPSPTQLTDAQAKMSEAMKQMNLAVITGNMRLGK